METNVKIYSWFDPPPCPGEENSGEVIVEAAGYVPAYQEIKDLIASGEQLAEARGDFEFQAGEEVPEDYINPHNHPDMDIVDHERALGTLAFQIKKEAAEAKKRKEDEEKVVADKKAADDKAAFDAAVTAKAQELKNGIS